MQIKELKSDKLYKEYSLEIPFNEIDKSVEEKVKNLIPNVSIPGFRKGKAPVNIVRKKYENNILNEVIEKVIQSNTSKLIKEKKLKLFRQPKIDLKKYEKNQPLEIEIKIDLQPDIKLKSFKSIDLLNYTIDVDKKLIDEQFKNFISSQKSYKKIDDNRSIKISDKIFINLISKDEEIPEYLRNQQNLSIDTESEIQILPEISKRLISKKMKVNDKIDISFDLSEVLKDKNKKNVFFNVELVSIEEKVEFELDKEFLEKNGFKEKSELKEFLKNNLEKQYNQGIVEIQKKQLMDILDNQYSFDLPQGILDEDFNEIWHRLEHAKKDNKLDEDDKLLSEDKLKARYKEISKRRVKLAVLLQFIAKEEKLTVTENDLSKAMMEYSSRYPGQEKQILEYFKKNPNSIENMKGPILEQKVIDSIISKATIKNKKITDKEFKKLEAETFNIKKENKKQRKK
tara:strand:+ start:63 stop:1430 length:1368 start_codon:yes stop_codon:yes gene_type:complete